MTGAAHPDSPRLRWERGLVLALTLAAFAHVAFGLAFKDLWWDESLSLQRAESALMPLVRGVIVIQDGFTQVPTIDQHPFFSFLLQGLLIRLAGESEFTLRFVSAASATLLVPVLYALSRLFVRRGVVPSAAPLWTALLVACSPFFLWYGQEARPYALWALLAVLSTYLLLVGLELRATRRWWRVGYAVTLAMFLTTHYYAVFLLPVHALVLYSRLEAHRRRLAIAIVAALMVIGAAIAGFALWNVLRQGGGGNFPRITLSILLPDLINAFSLGLSVDIDQVRWLNVIFAAVAAVGAAWMMRSRSALRSGGWVPAAAVVVPVVILLGANFVAAVYMNARHMSLIAGPFLMLVGAGLAVIGRQGRWAAIVTAALFLAGFGYSTANYYRLDTYQKDDYSALGAYMDGRIMPGDAVLYYPPSSWRIFEYYGPMAAVHEAAAKGLTLGVFGAPLLDEESDTFAWLAGLGEEYRRIWVLKSGTHPYYDLEGTVEEWLRANLVQVRDATFFSQSSLRAQLYLPAPPVEETLAPEMGAEAGIIFDDNLTLAGASIDGSAWRAGVESLPLPITLYWQVAQKPERRAKYILQLVEERGGQTRILGESEREPWEGDIPTTFWDPGKTILEMVELRSQPPSAAPDARLYLTLQMYDAETLDKLEVTDANGWPVAEDGVTVQFPIVIE